MKVLGCVIKASPLGLGRGKGGGQETVPMPEIETDSSIIFGRALAVPHQE
jgi:hypothetical protein